MNLRRALGRVVRMVTLTPQRADDEGDYVCIQCGAEHDRNYRECPECGRPYVTAREQEQGSESGAGKR